MTFHGAELPLGATIPNLFVPHGGIEKRCDEKLTTIRENCGLQALNNINLWDSFGRVGMIQQKIIPSE